MQLRWIVIVGGLLLLLALGVYRLLTTPVVAVEAVAVQALEQRMP